MSTAERSVKYAIPRLVVDAIRAVRDSGWVEMYDRETVMMSAATFGHENAAEWLVEHRHLYFIALQEVSAAAHAESDRTAVLVG